MFKNFSRQQAGAGFVTATALTGGASGNTEVVRPFLAEAAAVAFLDVRANGVETAHLLADQLPSEHIAAENLRASQKASNN